MKGKPGAASGVSGVVGAVGVLTVDHGQPGLMQEAHPAVLEEPDGEDGEREQQDECEQAHAVLTVALLSLLLSGELLHGAAVLGHRP